MSLAHCKGRLAGLSKELGHVWQDTTVAWRDEKATQLYYDCVAPLLSGADNAVVAMEDLEKLLRKLREDCEIE